MSPFWSSPFPLDPQQGQLRTSAEFPHFFLPKSLFLEPQTPLQINFGSPDPAAPRIQHNFLLSSIPSRFIKTIFIRTFSRNAFFFPSIFLFEKGSTLKYRTTKNIKQLSGGCLNGKKKSVDTRFYFFFISAF